MSNEAVASRFYEHSLQGDLPAVDGSPRTREGAQVPYGTDELRALLIGYANALDTVNDGSAIRWTKLERLRLLRWLRALAPRFLVRIFLARHVSRCVSTLKRNVARRTALADDAPGLQHDVKMLEHFEQSLPTGLRLAVIWPLGLLGTMLVAYILANFVTRADSSASKLLGDLTSASWNLDRKAALAALSTANKAAHGWLDSEANVYGLAAMTVAWSVTLMIALLLPAFIATRRLLAEMAGLETHGFAALGARRVHDIELDVVAQLLLVASLAIFGIIDLFSFIVDRTQSASADGWAIIAILVVLPFFAGAELRARYAVRRGGAKHQHRRITRLSLRVVWVLVAGMLILFVVAGNQPAGIDKPQDMKIGIITVVGCRPDSDSSDFLKNGCELAFGVTAIQQNTKCADPYRPLEPDEQFLRFDLDVWSSVDGFSNPELANALTRSHWGVETKDGSQYNDIYIYTKCGDGTEAISQPIAPGTHTKPVLVISAPKQTAFLQLDIPNLGAWRWHVPPAGS